MTARTRFIARQDQRRAEAAERRLAQGRQRRRLVESGVHPATWQAAPAGSSPVLIIERSD